MNVNRALEIHQIIGKLQMFRHGMEIQLFIHEPTTAKEGTPYVNELKGTSNYIDQKKLMELIKVCEDNKIGFSIVGADPDRYNPNLRQVQFNFFPLEDRD